MSKDLDLSTVEKEVLEQLQKYPTISTNQLAFRLTRTFKEVEDAKKFLIDQGLIVQPCKKCVTI